jgi:hypothetical protein
MKDTLILRGEVYDCAKHYKDHYGVSDMTWNRWRKAGKIPQALKIGNKLYYPRLATERSLVTTP